MQTEPRHISATLLQQITAEQAFYYRIVPVREIDRTLVLQTDTTPLEALYSELAVVLDRPLQLETCATETLDFLISSHYRDTQRSSAGSLLYTDDFLEKILHSAKEMGSSDIHFEPYEERCRIRFRLDGKLIEHYSIPIHDFPTMVNKIKIRAQLDIAEKRLPQDGRMTVKTGHEDFDLRVSTLPTLHGEKIVVRILTKQLLVSDITALGFSTTQLGIFKEQIKRPNGMVLISGPTGSGKTTTLYATLQLLNNDRTNILTIEDPIEYTLEGINQVQLKEAIGLDFPSALRTFLRQDPDVIMVGEIRDVKTANMAIRAALTGHLVLATIHTNSAWATVSRLIDMGVPPFLIANTLNISIAQRLVRKLCSHCKTEQALEKTSFPDGFAIPEEMGSQWVALGCNHCHHTGYQGRKAIYELLPIDRSLYRPIKDNQLTIADHMAAQHIPSLKDSALQLVMEGITTIEEVYPILMS